MRRFSPLPLLPLLLLVACAPGTTPAAAPGAEETRLKKAFVALRGTVSAPTSLIGNDGSTLIGNDGSTLVGNDGASLIGNDGSTLIGNDGSTYRLQAFASAPLANALVVVAGADGVPLKPLVKAKTDAQGRFTLTNVPAGRHVLIALAQSAAKQDARVLGLVTAIKAEEGIQLTAASSVITGAILEARAKGELADFDTPTYQRAVALAEQGLAAGDAPDLGGRKALVARAQALAAASDELAKLLDALKQQVAGLAPPRSGLPTATPGPTPTPAPTATPANGTGLGGVGVATPAPDGTAGPGGTPTPAPTLTPTIGPASTPTPGPTAPPAPTWVQGATLRLVAGSGGVGSTNGSFTSATFDRPESIVAGLVGNTAYYVGESGGRIRKLLPFLGTDTVSTWETLPTGGRALGIANEGNRLLVADAGRSQILEAGIVLGSGFSTIAGDRAGFLDGTGTAAMFSAPRDVAADGKAAYVADTGNGRIRRIDSGDVVSTVASGLSSPASVAIGPDGGVWFADTGSHRIMRILASQAQVVAGGTQGFADGPGATAQFNQPTGLAFVGSSLVVVDRGNRRLRLIASDGSVRTLAGTGLAEHRTGTGSQAGFVDPSDATGNDKGNGVWVTDAGANRVVEVTW